MAIEAELFKEKKKKERLSLSMFCSCTARIKFQNVTKTPSALARLAVDSLKALSD